MRDSGSLRMDEMELRRRVCAGKNCGLGNVTLTIKSHARENAAVFRVYKVLSGLGRLMRRGGYRYE